MCGGGGGGGDGVCVLVGIIWHLGIQVMVQGGTAWREVVPAVLFPALARSCLRCVTGAARPFRVNDPVRVCPDSTQHQTTHQRIRYRQTYGRKTTGAPPPHPSLHWRLRGAGQRH